MFDYSLPIATRTRQRHDKAYKELYEKKKKQEKEVGSSAPTDFKKSGSAYIVLSDDSMEEDSEGFNSDEGVAEGSEEEVGKRRSVEGRTRSGLDLSADSVADLDDSGKESVKVISLVSDSDDEAVSVSKQGGGGDSESVKDSDMRSTDSDEEFHEYSIEDDEDDTESISSDDYASDCSNDERPLNSDCETEDAKRSGAEGERAGICQKRKRNIRGDGDGQKFNCVAQRTRSRSGTHSSGGHDDQRDVYENQCSSQRNKRPKMNSQCNNRRSGDNDETYSFSLINGHDAFKTSEKSERPRKLTKKKSTREKRVANAYNILADSIYEDEELPPEGSASFGGNAIENVTLPLKFSFGKLPSIVPEEKSHFEKQVDRLFEEMEFAIRSAQIGSTDCSEVGTNDSVPPAKEVTQHMLCSQGEHYLILDEEIGMICKYCPHVHQEIKYIVPEFAPNPYGRSGKRFYEEDNWSLPDELQCHESGSVFPSSAHVDGTVWDLIPGVKSSMYPHQCEGFEFIWSHIAGGIHLEKLQKTSSADGGGGCIISHAPGTGKTRLTIVFLQAYMRFNPKCRPLIIAPRTMLLTWEEEFKKWGFDVPFHNLNNQSLSGKENKAALAILVQGGGQRHVKSVDGSRWLKLYSWNKERSILGISYRLFEKLSTAHNSGGKKADLAKKMRNILLDFPGIVVFDEGHTPRNDKSHMWKASSNIKTHRRIILSGTPFQNNFDELYNTIGLARPDWIMPTCSGRSLKRNVVKAQQMPLANDIAKGDGDKAKEAKKIGARIAPIVHVYRGSILRDTLPGLRNSVVVLQPSKLQKEISARIQEKNDLPFFKDEHYETLISVHPSALLNLEKEMRESLNQVDLERLKEKKSTPESGMKAKFVIELIRLSDAMNERVLVFSQYINALTFLKELLKSQFQWTEGDEVLYMYGADDEKQRQSSVKAFNDPSSKAKVLLASTRGCNEGINLVGASRVVLLDVTWNPSVERQAISRAYRLGQKKIVFIYHLLMAGAREEGKHSRQVEKHRLSELVFSCSDMEAAKKIPAVVAEDKILEEMVQHQKLKHMFEKITLLDEASCFD
ncbi:PREDICTED: SNF2 domain-containing protein CLASSY 3-like [Fragaria vesca subsp. vesca]|uniref:SNF2 domain-containing protein CLASSY 3-like n=1 Tax=Fragaria vesca subsp. vesca TaxID=101020 RepID=UPI0002C347C8|nr:PREDICTED: SNF2 domain-containing protein CLASSY 3-like [Fragaria vesca subsp. vesca]XP_011465200.1 PREDICTED: SNF2 domain-containing protein CLASSY 3-like [Fragaria vesca subsp. vesca]